MSDVRPEADPQAAAHERAGPAQSASVAQRWYGVGMMCLVCALSLSDRYSISTGLEPIRQELDLSDANIAFLTGVSLAIFHVTFGFPLSAHIDRRSRRNIIGISLIAWSALAAAAGFARSSSGHALASVSGKRGARRAPTPSSRIIFRPRAARWRCRSSPSASRSGPGSDRRRRARWPTASGGAPCSSPWGCRGSSPPRMRAMYCATLLFVATICNLIIGPQRVGLLSDGFAPHHAPDAQSPRLAMLCLVPTGFWAAWHYWRSARGLREDEQLALGGAAEGR